MTFAILWVALAIAPAQSAQRTNEAATSAKPDPMQKRVCRGDMATGSHLSKTTCHTKAEWAQIDAVSKRNAPPSMGVSGMQSEPFITR